MTCTHRPRGWIFLLLIQLHPAPLVDCTGRLVSSPAVQAGEAKEGVARGGAHLNDAERRVAGPVTPASAAESRSPEMGRRMRLKWPVQSTGAEDQNESCPLGQLEEATGSGPDSS